MLNFIRKYCIYIFVAIIILNITGGFFFYKQIKTKNGCSKIIFDINEKNLKKCENDKKSLEKKVDSLQEQIDNESKEIQPCQISPNSDLSPIDINTSKWRTFASSNLGISFNFPNDWYYLYNSFQNGTEILFYDKNGVEQMVLDDVKRSQYPSCLSKNNKIYFFDTNSSSTDLLISLNNDLTTEEDSKVELTWGQNLAKQDWINNTCRESKKMYININSKERNHDLSVTYEIASSFKILNNELLKSIDPNETSKQNNDYIEEIVMENPKKYFDNLGQMKIADISGVPGIFQEDVSMNVKVTYVGKIRITGIYNNYINQQGAYFQNQVCFYTEDKESISKIPRLKNIDYLKNSVSFCFSNKELAGKIFAPEGSSGTATIEVDNLIFHYANMGVVHYGDLLKVIEKNDGRKYLDEFSYSDQGYDIKLTSVDFNILENFNAKTLSKESSECGNDKNEEYYNKLLANYSEEDKGKRYLFSYQHELHNYENDPGEAGNWVVTVLENKLGYTDMDTFGKDFGQCFAGGDRYPKYINEKYLFFVSTSCGGADFYPDVPRCFDLYQFLEPTLEYY